MSYILLDTNILHYGTHKEFKNSGVDMFSWVQGLGLKAAISSYSKFEIYRGLKKTKIPSVRTLIETMSSCDVTDYTCRLAAALSSCYHHYESTSGKTYDDGDLIIGATALCRDFYILTASGNDFPRPFFEEEKSYKLTRCNKPDIVVQLLKPSRNHFNTIAKVCLF